MTQTQKVLAYLKERGSITPLEAFQNFGILAMHSRAAELRSEGYKVVCRIRTQGKTRWGEYFLVGDKP